MLSERRRGLAGRGEALVGPFDLVRDETRATEPEEGVHALPRIRSELQGAPQEALGGVRGDADERSLARDEKQLAGPGAHLRRRLAVLQRAVVVVRGDLRHLRLAARGDVLDPASYLAVELAALRARQGRVGDVVRKRVLEGELAHARHRGLGVLGDEGSRDERRDHRLVDADRARPEDAPHHRAAAECLA